MSFRGFYKTKKQVVEEIKQKQPLYNTGCNPAFLFSLGHAYAPYNRSLKYGTISSASIDENQPVQAVKKKTTIGQEH